MSTDRFQVKKFEMKKLAEKLSYPIKVNSLKDDRLQKELLGKFKFATVYGDNFTNWIQSTFGLLESFSTSELETKAIDLNISVQRAYIRVLPSSLGASVVFNVSYSCADNGLKKSDIYRGDATTLNWAFGHSEMMDVLNRSTITALDEMVEDINLNCSKDIAHLN